MVSMGSNCHHVYCSIKQWAKRMRQRRQISHNNLQTDIDIDIRRNVSTAERQCVYGLWSRQKTQALDDSLISMPVRSLTLGGIASCDSCSSSGGGGDGDA